MPQPAPCCIWWASSGFPLDDRHLKRAGLDYWEFVELEDAGPDAGTLKAAGYPDGRFFYLSTKAARSYLEAGFQPGDFIVFGKETKGLPEELLLGQSGNIHHHSDAVGKGAQPQPFDLGRHRALRGAAAEPGGFLYAGQGGRMDRTWRSFSTPGPFSAAANRGCTRSIWSFSGSVSCGDFLGTQEMNVVATMYGKAPEWHNITGIASLAGMGFHFLLALTASLSASRGSGQRPVSPGQPDDLQLLAGGVCHRSLSG